MDTISNIPATIDWHIYKGDTAIITIVLQNDDGSVVDTTGYTVLGQIREEPNSEDELQNLSTTLIENLLSVEIVDTASLPRLSYFDIQITKENNDIVTILKGSIYSEDDVSR